MPTRQHAVNGPAPEKRPSRPSAPDRTPAGDAVSVLVLRVLRLAARLTEAGDVLARPAGHTSARWQVLAGAESERATVADIARALGLARQSVQRVADVLADEGWVTWRDNPAHARAKLLGLTDKGRLALRQIQEAQRAWADELGARIGVKELAKATAVLDALLGALDAA